MKHLRLVEENLGEVTNELNFDALTESTTDLISELQDIYGKAKVIGDEITKLSESTNDVELKSTFIDLASSAYQLALDIEDAGQTVQDLKAEDIEIPEQSEDMEILEEIPDEEPMEEIPEEEEETPNLEEV